MGVADRFGLDLLAQFTDLAKDRTSDLVYRASEPGVDVVAGIWMEMECLHL